MLSDEEIEALAAEYTRKSRAEQGLPPTLTDPVEIAWIRSVTNSALQRKKEERRRKRTD